MAPDVFFMWAILGRGWPAHVREHQKFPTLVKKGENKDLFRAQNTKSNIPSPPKSQARSTLIFWRRHRQLHHLQVQQNNNNNNNNNNNKTTTSYLKRQQASAATKEPTTLFYSKPSND
jgi:hypothetical protein